MSDQNVTPNETKEALKDTTAECGTFHGKRGEEDPYTPNPMGG